MSEQQIAEIRTKLAAVITAIGQKEALLLTATPREKLALTAELADLRAARAKLQFELANLEAAAVTVAPVGAAPARRGARRAQIVVESIAEPGSAEPKAEGKPLRISVVNGDLSFIPEPLLLGHYRALKLTGTEKVMNRLVGGSMQQSLSAGVYPDEPGTHQIFMNTTADPDNPWRLPRPKAVIVLGLGAEGKLTPTSLAMSVRQAVVAWTMRLTEQRVAEDFEVAATLIGSGGYGISAGQSAQFVAQGVREANELIDQTNHTTKATWARVSRLTLVELYLDRASEAWHALRMFSAASAGRYLVDDTVTPGQGSLRRPPYWGYRGVDYDFISAMAEGDPGEERISYTLDTKRARTEVRAQATQASLLRRLVSGAADADNTDAQIGSTLFKLLVPVEVESFFDGSSTMVIELNDGTAGIPWELLDPGRDKNKKAKLPWAIRCQLLRKLRTADFSSQAADADAAASILIIGEPACDLTKYERLPGASREARAVCAALTSAGFGEDRIKSLISPEDGIGSGPDARLVLNALMDRDWRVVHISGHGEPPLKIGPVPKNPGDPPQREGDPRGVVLSDDTFVGPREIKSMRVVPELVFVNCCFLAQKDGAQLFSSDSSHAARVFSRPHFAATVAEALIRHGVRCVIAAGWAVDDEPASVFANKFYAALLNGQPFINAVSAARLAAYNEDPTSNTWAAYQCYGDPDWVLLRDVSDAQRPTEDIDAEFAHIASAFALRAALETIAVKSKFQKADPRGQASRLSHLEKKFGDLWGEQGDVAEAFGHAWSEAGDRPKAIEWFGRAAAAPDGSASLKALEQLGNLESRRAWETVRDVPARRSGVAKPANKALQEAAEGGRKTIAQAMARFDRLIDLTPTLERESLYGSAFKRLAMIEAAAGRPAEETKAIEGMRVHYGRAEKIGRAGQPEDLFYPAMNRMAAELAAAGPGTVLKGFDAPTVTAVRESAAARAKRDPDFWSNAAQTEVKVYEAVAARTLAGSRTSIESEYQDLYERVSAERMWTSVYDTASFVLSKYAKWAPKGEQTAANDLLKFLEQLVRKGATKRTAARRRGRANLLRSETSQVKKSRAKKAPAKKRAMKPSAKRASAKRTSAKKAPAKKAPAKRASAKKASAKEPAPAPSSRKTAPPSRAAVKRAPKPEISPTSARAYVEAAKVPQARRRRGGPGPVTEAAFDSAKNQAAVVGSDIISFVQGVTPERRQAIVNSSLLAQLVARTKVGDPSKVYDWYDAYFDVLTNIGWVVQDRNFAEYHESSNNFDAHKAILSVLTALLGAAPAALALVKTTLEALQSMNADSPFITVWDRESRHAKTARFQISLAEQDAEGQFFVTLMAFGLEATSTVTQVLFFRSRASEATLKHYSGKVTINTEVLDSVRDAIAAKLTAHSADFVKKLPDLGPVT